jgi:hypothetical protein
LKQPAHALAEEKWQWGRKGGRKEWRRGRFGLAGGWGEGG